jgi:hypothetical protein
MSLVLDCSSIPTDLILNVGGRIFNVHRFMMIIRSPYFNTMLTGGFKEKNMQLITIPDIDADVFNEFLNLVYGRPHISSPALMTIVHMYGVTGIALGMLHKQFDVPIEQFREYVEAMISLYPLPMKQEVIDIIASKITSADYKDHIPEIPQNIKDKILVSKKMPFYGNIAIVEQLLVEARKEKENTGKTKFVYRLNHPDDDSMYISAHGPADALLRIRHEHRLQHYDAVIAAQHQYDTAITQDILEQIRMGAEHPSGVKSVIAKKLPDLAPGTRYVYYRDNRFDIIDEIRPSMARWDESEEGEFFSWYKNYMEFYGDDIRSLMNFIWEEDNVISAHETENLFSFVTDITIREPLEAHPTHIPNVYSARISNITYGIDKDYAIIYDDDQNMICFGSFDGDVLHSLTKYEAHIIRMIYHVRVFGALLEQENELPRIPHVGPIVPPIHFTPPVHSPNVFTYTKGSLEKIDGTMMVVDNNINLAFAIDINGVRGECLGVYDKQSKKLMPASVELLRTIR